MVVWTCEVCNEKIDDNFDKCWNCAEVKDNSIKSFKINKNENKPKGYNSRFYQVLFLIIALFYSIKKTYYGKYGFLNNELAAAYNKIYSDIEADQRVKVRGIFDTALLGEFLGSFIEIIFTPLILASIVYFFTKRKFWAYVFFFQTIFFSYKLLYP